MSDINILNITVEGNKSLSKEEIEDELIKATDSILLKREKKEFRDQFLKDRKNETEKAIQILFKSMLDEIEKVLKN